MKTSWMFCMCSKLANVQIFLIDFCPLKHAVFKKQIGTNFYASEKLLGWFQWWRLQNSVSMVNEKHVTNLRGSAVLMPPLDEPVQDYLAPYGSDPYSSHIASCTGTEGKVSKIISIKKKNPSANLLLRSNQSNTSMEHQREMRNTKSKTKTRSLTLSIKSFLKT